MNDSQKGRQRIEEVRQLLAEFSQQYLSAELTAYVFKLWEQIGRKKTYSITGGKKEIWASAVVYIIARLNFLFDSTQQYYLPPDKICGYFGTKKSTISAKAAEIEKACRIRIGEEGLCSPAITESLQFVELSNGMIVSKRMAREMGLI